MIVHYNLKSVVEENTHTPSDSGVNGMSSSASGKNLINVIIWHYNDVSMTKIHYNICYQQLGFNF